MTRDQIQQPAVGQPVLVHQRSHRSRRSVGYRSQRLQVNLHVKVARVGKQRPGLHHQEVLAPQHRSRAGHGHEHVAARRRRQ
jgi:hypothetical protein